MYPTQANRRLEWATVGFLQAGKKDPALKLTYAREWGYFGLKLMWWCRDVECFNSIVVREIYSLHSWRLTMPCDEIMQLENIWRQRYEGARLVERSGLFAVPAKNSHAWVVRQHRAKQAQAANAILQHQRSCAVCSSRTQLGESRAS